MTQQEEKRVIEIYGPDYLETDIPTYIRNRDAEVSESEDDEGVDFDYHPRPEQVFKLL